MNKQFLFMLIVLPLLCALGAEQVQAKELLEDQVYVVIDQDEIRAFSSSRGQWISIDLAITERVLDTRYDGNTIIAVTDRRAFGFSEITGSWSQIDLEINERLIKIVAVGNVGSVITSERALGFSAQTAKWSTSDLHMP
ncbi:MAG: hypothetical protein KQH63_07600 [Desulfobulbaceae bacterium]|nr:hypothetical protein [Desulfobulbaceae bacterium]